MTYVNSLKLFFYKGHNTALIPFLNQSEIDCKCTNKECTITPIDYRLIIAFYRLRNVLGLPLTITSGHRCEAHNKAIGGAVNSYHVKGMALDIACPVNDFEFFANACKQFFPKCIEYKEKNFVHCQVL